MKKTPNEKLVTITLVVTSTPVTFVSIASSITYGSRLYSSCTVRDLVGFESSERAYTFQSTLAIYSVDVGCEF